MSQDRQVRRFLEALIKKIEEGDLLQYACTQDAILENARKLLKVIPRFETGQEVYFVEWSNIADYVMRIDKGYYFRDGGINGLGELATHFVSYTEKPLEAHAIVDDANLFASREEAEKRMAKLAAAHAARKKEGGVMSFDPDLLIKMGDVREVIRDETRGKVTTVELIHILFELKKHAFPPRNKTDKADDTDAAEELPRHRCGNCEHSEIILQSGKCRARCKLNGQLSRTRHVGCEHYRPIKEAVVKKDERRCWMCNSFREDVQIKDEGPAYDCPSVGHAAVRQDKACRAFEPRPDIEVEP